MDIIKNLNSIEIAFLFWLIVFGYFSFRKAPLSGVKGMLRTILTSKVLLLAIGYVVFCILIDFSILTYFGVDLASQRKNIAIWILSVPFAIPVRLINAKEDSQLSIVTDVIADNFKFSAMIELIITTYTFPLYIQIPLTGLIILISLISVVAGINKDTQIVKVFMDRLITIVTLPALIIVFANLIRKPGDFFNESTLIDYLLPLAMSLIYLPFAWGMFVWVHTETTLQPLKITNGDRSVYIYAFKRAFFEFFFHPDLANRFKAGVLRTRIYSKGNVDKLIHDTVNFNDADVLPPKVDKNEGWSPAVAQRFLIDENLKTSFYNKPLDDDSFFASSNPLDISEGLLCNKIMFWIEGSEQTVTSLTLRLSIYNFDERDQSIQTFSRISELLTNRALETDPPVELKDAINNLKSVQLEIAKKKVSFTTNEYRIAAPLLELHLTIQSEMSLTQINN